MLVARCVLLEVDARGDELVAPREAHRRGGGGLGGGREQGVDAAEQPLALRLPGWIGQPLRREERRDGQRGGVAQGEIREARQARLEPVYDVEAAGGEPERKVRAHADGDAHPAAARDRHRGAERDDVRVEA